MNNFLDLYVSADSVVGPLAFTLKGTISKVLVWLNCARVSESSGDAK